MSPNTNIAPGGWSRHGQAVIDLILNLAPVGLIAAIMAPNPTVTVPLFFVAVAVGAGLVLALLACTKMTSPFVILMTAYPLFMGPVSIWVGLVFDLTAPAMAMLFVGPLTIWAIFLLLAWLMFRHASRQEP